MGKGLFFLLGLAIGSFITVIYFKYSGNSHNNKPYFKLQANYKIEGVDGYLKKGTIIRIDEGMDEGFDRYILYLNIKGGKLQKIDSLNGVYPYWLSEVTSQ